MNNIYYKINENYKKLNINNNIIKILNYKEIKRYISV